VGGRGAVVVARPAAAAAAADLTMYIARETSKVWRKVTTEISVELQLLRDKWGLLLAGLIFQVSCCASFCRPRFWSLVDLLSSCVLCCY